MRLDAFYHPSLNPGSPRPVVGLELSLDLSWHAPCLGVLFNGGCTTDQTPEQPLFSCCERSHL
jgi:hypothetical protein